LRQMTRLAGGADRREEGARLCIYSFVFFSVFSLLGLSIDT
jgi:hypothetical protein